MFSDRLEELRKEHNLTQKKLAEIAKVSPVAVKKWLDGDTKNVAGVYITALADYFHVNSSWLVTGQGPKSGSNIALAGDNSEDDYVQIKENQVRFDCGSGTCAPTWEEINDGSVCVYKRSFFRDLGVNPTNCVRVRAHGDSMAPLICNGDYVLIDTSQHYDIIDGKIYAIGVEGQLRIKRLYRKTNKGLVIRSENKEYVDEVLTPEEANQYVTIIGRVIDRSGSNPFK